MFVFEIYQNVENNKNLETFRQLEHKSCFWHKAQSSCQLLQTERNYHVWCLLLLRFTDHDSSYVLNGWCTVLAYICTKKFCLHYLGLKCTGEDKVRSVHIWHNKFGIHVLTFLQPLCWSMLLLQCWWTQVLVGIICSAVSTSVLVTTSVLT